MKSNKLLNEIAALEDRIQELKRTQVLKDSSPPCSCDLHVSLGVVFEKSPVPAAIVRDDKRLFANRAYAALFGYQYLSELNGMSLLKQFAPQARDQMLERWRKKAEGEKTNQTYEALGQKVNGEVFPININEVDIELPDGKASVLFVTDISEKKQNEKKIQHLASFPDLDPRPILEIDFSGAIVYCNNAAVKILKDFGIDDQRTFLPADIKDLLTAFQLVDHGSTYREVSIENRIFGEDISLASGFNTIRLYADDITGSIRSQQLLQESENKYRELIENQGEGIIVVDKNEVITFVNPAGAAIFGRSQESMLGQQIIVFVTDACKQTVIQEAEKRRLGKKSNYELEILNPDGKKIHIWVTVTPAFNDHGALIGSLGVFRDITERRSATEKLQKSYEQIKKVLEGTINALSTALSKRDPYTMEHQRRVTKLACAIASDMQLPGDQIEGIRVAGLLHDIGKLNIPSEILTKPEKLTKAEFEIIKIHPQASFDIIQGIEFPWPISTIVLQHHEKINGSGYPANLTEKEILLESKVLTVADVVEAMSSHRPYRPSLGLQTALDDVMANAGILYDRVVVDTCIRLFMKQNFSF
jgi:PAS domain S-box-containing protein/putative nucleotidyltransferase with HDIG domain